MGAQVEILHPISLAMLTIANRKWLNGKRSGMMKYFFSIAVRHIPLTCIVEWFTKQRAICLKRIREMSKQIVEIHELSSKRRIGDASAYSAHIQEAMRYDRLPSAHYSLVMTILNAVVQGYTEEKWKEEQQQALKTLVLEPTNPKTAHADLANRYEQTVGGLKDLSLWPW
jgi:hypothetical protein